MKPFGRTLFALIPLLAACGSVTDNVSSSVDKTTQLQVGQQVALLEGVEEDFEHGFYDGFETLNPESWMIGKGYWGVNNGGVSPKNVFLTDDGQLLLRGLGSYYSKGEVESYGAYKDGRKCGACLVSRFGIGPGHYEIRMKALPRQGACTAFWTYGNRAVEGEENENAEIDWELPGGSKSGRITFEKGLNTNWVSEMAFDSVEFALDKVYPDADFVAFNDEKYHTYAFDWYTDPEMVVYSVDGVITNISTLFVPTLEGRLWLGVWFPDGFVGSADFEEDYMTVDHVRYTPFLNQPVNEFDAVPSLSEAPKEDYEGRIREPSKANKVSGGDFEFASRLESASPLYGEYIQNKGWSFLKKVTEKKPLEEVCYPISNSLYGKGGENVAMVQEGGVLRQNIDSVYEGYEYDFSFDGKALQGEGKALVKFFGASEDEVLEEQEIAISSSDFQTYGSSIKAPKGSQSLRLEFRSNKGVVTYIDNVKLYRK